MKWKVYILLLSGSIECIRFSMEEAEAYFEKESHEWSDDDYADEKPEIQVWDVDGNDGSYYFQLSTRSWM